MSVRYIYFYLLIGYTNLLNFRCKVKRHILINILFSTNILSFYWNSLMGLLI